MQAVFAKVPGGLLMPACTDAKRFIASLSRDEGVLVEVSKVTDMRLHRKLFALLELAFDAWEPNDDLLVLGESRRKDFNHFRSGILILAGHCDAQYSSSGVVRLNARSISLSECAGHEFELVYRAVLDVVWSRVLKYVRYTSPAQAERVIDELLTYE